MGRMRQVYDKRRKLMVELVRGVGFGIPAMPQGAFYVFILCEIVAPSRFVHRDLPSVSDSAQTTSSLPR